MLCSSVSSISCITITWIGRQNPSFALAWMVTRTCHSCHAGVAAALALLRKVESWGIFCFIFFVSLGIYNRMGYSALGHIYIVDFATKVNSRPGYETRQNKHKHKQTTKQNVIDRILLKISCPILPQNGAIRSEQTPLNHRAVNLAIGFNGRTWPIYKFLASAEYSHIINELGSFN